MEEKKEGCEHGNCEKCKDSKCGMNCSHICCGKYHLLKVIVIIFLIVVIFCFGAMFGRKNDLRGRDAYQRFMMNNGYGLKGDLNNNDTGSVTVKVLPQTTTPPVTQ
jgi:hypothetical protein